MSKITFRADDELVQRLEEFDASKSEVMREALREYLDGAEREPDGPAPSDGTVDDALSARIDALIDGRLGELVDERIDERLDERLPDRSRERAVNVNVNLKDEAATSGRPTTERASASSEDVGRKTRTGDGDESEEQACDQCGESVSVDHVYCPNCGEKSTHRVFCDCGDEVRSDWAFCPGCGRRTPAADVLDRA